MFTRNQFSPVVIREGTEVIFSKEKGKGTKKNISPSAAFFFPVVLCKRQCKQLLR